MILKIEYKEAIEDTSEEQIIISFNKGKNKIVCSQNSENWNSDGINSFLIDLASATPEDESIELEYQENNKANYRHVVSLFDNFIKEFNKKIANKG